MYFSLVWSTWFLKMPIDKYLIEAYAHTLSCRQTRYITLVKKNFFCSSGKLYSLSLICRSRTTDTWRLNPQFFAAQIQISIGLVFCRNNGWIMENMDKGLTVPKWVLIIRPKIPQMPQNLSQNLSTQPSQKVLDFNEKGFIAMHWASVVRRCTYVSELRSEYKSWKWERKVTFMSAFML